MTIDFAIKLIREMKKVDQDLRFKAKDEPGLANYLVYLADAAHGVRIHRIIENFEFPQTEQIGAEAMNDLWLLIQHQDLDPDLQEKCLENCDFAPSDKAYLTDRVQVNQGKPQIYGTQYMFKDDKRVLCDMAEPQKVDERRKQVGLPRLSEQQ